MAVPFSNTALRVPCGFGNILEGLAREVLREQPEDIPTFAAQYFTALLQKREESGLDPAKWGALMEQRFSNNDAFKDAVNQENCSPVKETTSSLSEDKDFQVGLYEDKITENFSPSPDILDAPEDIEEPESQLNKELNISEDESAGTDSELNPDYLYTGTADVDICAEELNKMETVEEQMLESVQEPASVDKENEIAEKELNPIMSSEELCSTLQEGDHTEASGDMTVTDAGFVPPSESPDPVLFEQDVLDTNDEFIPSGTGTSVYVEQNLDKLNDISCSEETIGSSVKEDEVGQTGHLHEDVGRKANVLLHDAGPLHLNEGTESVSVSKAFDEMNTDEVPLGIENQQADDMLAAEAMSESSFTPEKDSLAILNNEDRPGMEDLANVTSEVQVENNGCESNSDAIAATGETDHQTDIKKDETNYDKPTDPKDISKMIPVEEIEGLVGSNLNPTGFSAVDVNKDDSRTSQQVVVEVKDTSDIGKENNSVNEPETQEDNMFYSTFTHESKDTLPVPTFEKTEQDMEMTYKPSARDLQEHPEETEAATDFKESQHQEDLVHDPTLESEKKELDQQEESSQPQEEEDIMDIPLDDPEANKAAAKIQAGFRGHMTRKKLKPGDKPGEEVSSTGEALNGSQGDAAGGSEGVETDETSVPEQ